MVFSELSSVSELLFDWKEKCAKSQEMTDNSRLNKYAQQHNKKKTQTQEANYEIYR